jgi:rRNA maturation endonuclease Nob1
MGSCIDLRKYLDSEEVQEVFSRVVSGRKGYKAIIERKKEIPKCPQCTKILEGEEKFCPECGHKLKGD